MTSRVEWPREMALSLISRWGVTVRIRGELGEKEEKNKRKLGEGKLKNEGLSQFC